MPGTVQAILTVRIDRLPAEEKRLLEIAAVIGKDFPLALLLAVADENEGTIRRGLGHLQTAEFLYETRLFPDLEYTFKHALTHEVVYGSLLPGRRRDLHARIVETVERLYGDRLAEQIERLAHHALCGEVKGKAVHYLRQAGIKAAARSALRDARSLARAGAGCSRNVAGESVQRWSRPSTSISSFVRCCTSSGRSGWLWIDCAPPRRSPNG